MYMLPNFMGIYILFSQCGLSEVISIARKKIGTTIASRIPEESKDKCYKSDFNKTGITV